MGKKARHTANAFHRLVLALSLAEKGNRDLHGKEIFPHKFLDNNMPFSQPARLVTDSLGPYK